MDLRLAGRFARLLIAGQWAVLQRRHLLLVLSLFICLLASDARALGPQRVALVIGNAAYREHPLKNPVADARLMASTLGNAGFEVMQGTDLSQREMYRLVTAFREKAETADVAVMYFAGHGVQINGTNYLIPVDLEPRSEHDVTVRAVDLDRVVELMQDGRGRVNVIVVDACRDNPFGATRSFGAKGGLGEIRSRPGTLIAYSTSPGSTAADSTAPGGRNSVYTYALANAINTPNLPVEEAFKIVRRDVLRATRGRQVPWEATSLTVAFSLNDRAGGSAIPAARQAAQSPAQAKGAAGSGRGLGLTPAEFDDITFLLPEQARERLAKMGVPWSNQAFAAALKEGDGVALNLFLKGGKNVFAMAGNEAALGAVACGENRARTVQLLAHIGIDLNRVYERRYRVEGIWITGTTHLLHEWMSRCANDDEAFAQALVEAGVRWPAGAVLSTVPNEHWDKGMLVARRATLKLIAGQAFDPAFGNYRLYDTAMRWEWMNHARADRTFIAAIAPRDPRIAQRMVHDILQQADVPARSPSFEVRRRELDDDILCTYRSIDNPEEQALCIAQRRQTRAKAAK